MIPRTRTGLTLMTSPSSSGCTADAGDFGGVVADLIDGEGSGCLVSAFRGLSTEDGAGVTYVGDVEELGERIVEGAGADGGDFETGKDFAEGLVGLQKCCGGVHDLLV